MYISCSTTELTAGNITPVLFYNKLTTDQNRGDFEAGNTYAYPNTLNATEISIPEINKLLGRLNLHKI